MMSKKEDEFGSHWLDRIDKAEEYFKDWEKKFKCKTLNRYYEGQISEQSSQAYYINLFYASVKVKKPNLIFSRPTFTVAPKPWKMDWNPDSAITTAQLKQDTLNSFVQDRYLNFAEEINMAIQDSWSYFGLMEVGYSANWIQNPNAGMPVLKSDYYEKD